MISFNYKVSPLNQLKKKQINITFPIARNPLSKKNMIPMIVKKIPMAERNTPISLLFIKKREIKDHLVH